MTRTSTLRPAAGVGALLLCTALAACGSCNGCKGHHAQPVVKLSEASTPRVIELWLDTPPEEGGKASIFSSGAPQLQDVIRVLREAAHRREVKGVFVRLGPMSGAWGRAFDLIAALRRVHDAGKPVECHFQTADNASTLVLESACDRITVSPAGMMNLVGPSAQVFYAKSLLDKIGVQADLMQIGKYKGAADPFTMQQMPDTTRESLGAVLDQLRGNIVDALVTHRHMSRARARSAIDGGPYDAEAARAAGLVDAVEYDDQAREHARAAGKAPRVKKVDLVPRAEPIGFGELISALSGKAPSVKPQGPHLGLVILQGTIVDDQRSGTFGVRSGPVVRELRRMADDDDIKAVVLRIDSPGGSALASDEIWHAVRRVAKHKPVIASVGDMAASGGYYIASAATKIIAPDDSLVGSIGVVGGKVQLTDLASKLGVNVVVLKRGNHAAWTSPFEPMSDAERQMFERLLRDTYDRFIHRVAAGRGISEAKVRAAAEGRLLTGARARQLGLVDEEGGFERAMERARKAGGLPSNAAVERWPEQKTLLDTIAKAMGGKDQATARTLLKAVGPLGGPLSDALVLPEMLERERVAVALPFVVRIE